MKGERESSKNPFINTSLRGKKEGKEKKKGRNKTRKKRRWEEW